MRPQPSKRRPAADKGYHGQRSFRFFQAGRDPCRELPHSVPGCRRPGAHGLAGYPRDGQHARGTAGCGSGKAGCQAHRSGREAGEGGSQTGRSASPGRECRGRLFPLRLPHQGGGKPGIRPDGRAGAQPKGNAGPCPAGRKSQRQSARSASGLCGPRQAHGAGEGGAFRPPGAHGQYPRLAGGAAGAAKPVAGHGSCGGYGRHPGQAGRQRGRRVRRSAQGVLRSGGGHAAAVCRCAGHVQSHRQAL